MSILSGKLRNTVRSLGYDVVKYKGLPELLALHQIDVVLDVGANDGGYATGLRASGWKGRIISFEPQPQAFARLSKKFASDRGWSGHQIGLGSKNEVMEMNIHEMDVLSSFLHKHDSEPLDRVAVEVKRLDGILPTLVQHGSRVFVKLDTQGFEKEIILGCGEMTQDIMGWQLEMSVQTLYENQMKIEESITTMRTLGFSLWQILPGLRDPHTHQSFEFDGIFFRAAEGKKKTAATITY